MERDFSRGETLHELVDRIIDESDVLAHRALSLWLDSARTMPDVPCEASTAQDDARHGSDAIVAHSGSQDV